MEKILHDLGELLLKAVPTFLLVGLLYVYLRWMFFGPLERVLETRRQATEGARKLAEETFAKAAEKTAQYEAGQHHIAEKRGANISLQHEGPPVRLWPDPLAGAGSKSPPVLASRTPVT